MKNLKYGILDKNGQTGFLLSVALLFSLYVNKTIKHVLFIDLIYFSPL